MISRDFVLKNFNKKLLEAKKQRVKDFSNSSISNDSTELKIDGGEF